MAALTEGIPRDRTLSIRGVGELLGVPKSTIQDLATAGNALLERHRARADDEAPEDRCDRAVRNARRRQSKPRKAED